MRFAAIGLYARITFGALLLVVAGGLLWVHSENQRLHEAYLSGRETDLATALEVERIRLIQSVNTLRQDVLFLANTPPISGIARAAANHGFDPRDKNSYAKWEARLQEIFSAFLRAHPDYFQIRYIGLAAGGRELVQVENIEGYVNVAPRAALQAEGDNAYFKNSLLLRAGDVQLSRIAMERETGRIEELYRPTLAAVTPVFDAGGHMFGLIVLDADVRPWLAAAASGLPLGVQSYIADQEGRYLFHPDARHLVTFEPDGKGGVAADFPVLGPLLSGTQSVNKLPLQAESADGAADYLAAERIFFDADEPTHFLLLVYRLSADAVARQSGGIPAHSVFNMIFIVIAVGGVFMLMLRRAFLPLRRISAAAHEIATGKRLPHLHEKGGGEIRELVDALNLMLVNLTEGELHKRENTFRKDLIESLPGAFYMIDAGGRFLMWNQNLEKVLQRSGDEIAASSPLDFFNATDKSNIEKAIRDVFETGEAVVEAFLVAKDGTQTPYHFSGRRVVHNGQALLVGMGLDITEQRREANLKEFFLRRNQALMQNSMEGVHILDIDGNVLEVNDAFCNMLGYTREEVLRLNVADWDRQFSAEELRERIRGFIGKSGIFETVHRRKDGSLVDVEICTNGVEFGGECYLFASSRDITARKNMQSVLQRYKLVLETTHDGFWLTDMQGNLLEANKAYADISGYTVDELARMHISQLEAQEKSLDEVKAHIARIVEQGYDVFETRHRHKDGHEIDIEVSTTFMRDTRQFVVFSRDISERKQAEQELRVAAAAFETHDAILVTDAQSNIIRVNRAFTEITGFSAAEVVGSNPSIMSSGRQDKAFYAAMWQHLLMHGSWAGEIWDRRKSGEVYPKWMTITAVKNERGETTQYVAIFSDISARKQAEEEIRNLAFYDALTKLPNRRLLLDRFRLALSVSARSQNYGAVLFLDMDKFKTLNDTLGHNYGDMMLVEVARRIQSCVREMDTVARLGGDEFVVLLEEIDGQAESASQKVAQVAEKIRLALSARYCLDTSEYHSSPSIGVCLYRGNGESVDNLLKYADMAMYQAKDSGRNAVRFFDPLMQQAVETRALLESDLRRAISERQLHLYYQMQMDNGRHPIGAEALLRWNHPRRGMVPPAQFIPIAEDSSLILEVGGWVLDTACRQLAAWAANEKTRDLILAVNVSSHQFRRHDFVATVAAALHAHTFAPSLLKLELTESVVLDDVTDVARKMKQLKELGVRLSLDDFGTGYSSLSYLKNLPLDQIKIDQSFVRDIATDANDAVMVQTIIGMAQNFRLHVIAEGVETEAQLAFLKQHGCMAYQGYLFSKPVPIEEFDKLIEKC